MAFKFTLYFILAMTSLCARPGEYGVFGKDSDLFGKKIFTSESKQEIPSFFQQIAEGCIFFHQQVISPADGPRSHFRPTSSRYMLLAIRKHGLGKGFLMGCDRLLRENSESWVYRTVEVDGKLYKYDMP